MGILGKSRECNCAILFFIILFLLLFVDFHHDFRDSGIVVE